MKKRNIPEIVLFNISRFMSFFLLMCFVVTTTMLLFLHDMELDMVQLRKNAMLTFLNVVFLSLLFCGFDALRRHLMVERHLHHILDALEKIRQGDFSVRLDVKERDYSQGGFAEISRGINHLAQELSGLETLRTDFMANVSHELKTPLAVVQNYATMLQSPALSDEKREEYTKAIIHTTRRLADLVTNILKLNKLENQQIYPEEKVFDLGEQLCECLLNFETAWEDKNLELECDIADSVLVEADPELLQLVWNNLFSNAIKFTPNGGLITVRLETDANWASVTVTDTGCGMTRETGAHIFEKFYQGDTAHSTQGNGLGLALVKRVVDITGGIISVASTPGKGSTFTVRIEKQITGENNYGK